MRIDYFEAATGGFLFGIFIASVFDLGLTPIIFTLFLAVLAFSFSFSDLLHRKIFLTLAIGLFACTIGMGRYFIAPQATGSLLRVYVGKNVALRGVILDEPDIRETSQRLSVQVRSLDGQPIKKENMLAIMPLYPRFAYGDEVEFSGAPAIPTTGASDASDFDWAAYLAKDDIFTVIYKPSMSVVSTGNGSPLKRALFAIKNTFLGNLNRVIPEPASALAGGLTVGARQSLGTSWLDLFKKVGLIHMVVLSGYNLTVIAQGAQKLLKHFSERVRFGIGGALIILFTIMTGAGAATVRSAIMALIALFARDRGRTLNLTRALLAAAVAMVLFAPKILVFDRGFELSFLATMGLVYLSPLIETRLGFVPEKIWKFEFRGVLATTLAAQLAVFPWILYTTGNMSPIALITNILVLPLVPLTMAFVALTGVSGFFAALISLPFAWASYVLLNYELFVVKMFAKIPFGYFQLTHVSLLVTLFLYILIIASAVYFWKLEAKKMKVLGTEG